MLLGISGFWEICQIDCRVARSLYFLLCVRAMLSWDRKPKNIEGVQMHNLLKCVFGDGCADHVFAQTIYRKYSVSRARETNFPKRHLRVCTEACAHMDETRQNFGATPYISVIVVVGLCFLFMSAVAPLTVMEGDSYSLDIFNINHTHPASARPSPCGTRAQL